MIIFFPLAINKQKQLNFCSVEVFQYTTGWIKWMSVKQPKRAERCDL